MDDPNMANEQPAADLPPEANVGESESPVVPLPAAETPPADAAPLRRRNAAAG